MTSTAIVQGAARAARRHLPARLHGPLDAACALLLGHQDAAGAAHSGSEPCARELVIRFQQTCGPVMAKGVEDTAFYRWSRLAALNEVGGDPDRFGVSPAEFHAFAGRLARDWPATMTTLSTHDTKRQEDVRARLAVLAESPRDGPGRWRSGTTGRSGLSGGRAPAPDTEYLHVADTARGLADRARSPRRIPAQGDAGGEDGGHRGPIRTSATRSLVLAFADAVLGDTALTARIDRLRRASSRRMPW